eukprot:15478657-Alexandrium_andersonii.AAC.1
MQRTASELPRGVGMSTYPVPRLRARFCGGATLCPSSGSAVSMCPVAVCTTRTFTGSEATSTQADGAPSCSASTSCSRSG